VISFSTAISACANASQPEVATELFEKLEDSQLQANQVTFNAILDALRAQPDRAREFWRLGMERGFYADVEDLQSGVSQLDLHELSEGAAEAAVRWWLEEASVARLRADAAQRLEVITGWGKTRSSYQDGDLRAAVEEVFHEMEVPLLPTTNPGSLVVDLTRWPTEQG